MSTHTTYVAALNWIGFYVTVRGSTGISVNLGPPNYDPVTTFQKDDSKSCKCLLFSPDSKKFAWANGTW